MSQDPPPTTANSGSQHNMAFGPAQAGAKGEATTRDAEDQSKSAASTRKKRPTEKIRHDAASRSPDERMVDETKTQIRNLVQEISDLARTAENVEAFYEGFLTRTVSALASIGGVIWTRDSEDQPLQAQFHINLRQTSLHDDAESQKRHAKLIQRMVETGQPQLVPPDSGSTDPKVGGNPTEHLLILGPLKVDNAVIGMVEIFQRPGAGPTTQRGYLRFLMQMCEIAGEFLGNQRLRAFEQQQQMWHRLEKFIKTVHQSLDLDETIFSIANEGRRLIDCDRVSVALKQGRHCTVKSVSGLDSIERRSEQVKKLGRLATTVVRAGSPLWYDGEDTDLPPQIEKRVHDYVDKSHSKMLAIIPLMMVQPTGDDEASEEKKRPAEPIGALIVEQLKDARITPALENRAAVVVDHGQRALANSLDHHRIFLMPLWKAMGKFFDQFHGRKLLRTGMVAGAVAASIAFACLFPYPFSLGAKGALIPETSHEVYAQLDGVLKEVLVSDTGDSMVEQGQLLARMTSSDLDLAIKDLDGRILQAQEEYNVSNSLRSNNLTPAEQQTNELRLAKSRQLIKNLRQERAVRAQDVEMLDIVAPSAGRVVNWQVRQNLIRRPVRYGQHLMTIVDPDTQWMIELEMPERRVAHLVRAMKDSEETLSVTFGLVSHPGSEFTGTLVSVDQKMEVHSDEGNAALVRVIFPNDAIEKDLLRSGTRVNAQVHCGTTSIGYAMCHELIETVQSKWMLWF